MLAKALSVADLIGLQWQVGNLAMLASVRSSAGSRLQPPAQ